MDPIDAKDIMNKDPFYVVKSLDGTAPATAGNYGIIFTALQGCEVIGFSEVHQTAGTDGGAVTLQLEKLTGTQALDAGVVVLAATVNLKGTANTVVYPSLTATKADRQLNRGDRLALKDGGVMTAVAGLQVSIRLKSLGKGHFSL